MSGGAVYGDELGSNGGRLGPGLPGSGGPIGPGVSIGAADVRSPGGLAGAAVSGQLNAGGKIGSSGGRLVPGLPSAGGSVDVGIFRSPVAGDPLSVGTFSSPTGLTSHAGSAIGPRVVGSPFDPRGVRPSPGFIGAAGNGVAGNAPNFMSISGATGSFPFTTPTSNPNVSPPFLVPGNADQLIAQDLVSPFHINGHHSPHMSLHPPNLEEPCSSFIASQVIRPKSIAGHFAIGSFQSLLHHFSSSAAVVGRVPETSICDGSDHLLSTQTNLDGSHVQTCGYSSWNDGSHVQVTASSPIDQEVDDAPGQDSSDSDIEDPLQDEHMHADAEDSDGSSQDAVPINNQSTLQGSGNGSSEDAVPTDNQSPLQGPANGSSEDAVPRDN